MGKIIRNQNIEKFNSDFVLLLVCLIYRSKVPKNVKMICVAICGGSSNNMTGLHTFKAFPEIVLVNVNVRHIQKSSVKTHIASNLTRRNNYRAAC